LSATRFFARDTTGNVVGAKIEGLRWEGAAGLLEEQEAFLRRQIS
jgi:hypothetical protein